MPIPPCEGVLWCLSMEIFYCVDPACACSVVTNHGYSDWSTQPWPFCELRLRLHKIGSSYVSATCGPVLTPSCWRVDQGVGVTGACVGMAGTGSCVSTTSRRRTVGTSFVSSDCRKRTRRAQLPKPDRTRARPLAGYVRVVVTDSIGVWLGIE